MKRVSFHVVGTLRMKLIASVGASVRLRGVSAKFCTGF